MQEVILGAECTVLIGSQEFEWEQLAEAASCLRHDADRAIEVHECIRLIGQLTATSVSDRDKSFLNILGHSYQLLCTNPLETVFGILGIASDIETGELVPDYSLTREEVCSNAARFIISKYRFIAWVYHVKFSQASQELPSWVPDRTAASPVRKILASRNENYTLIHTEKPRASVSTNRWQLQSRGSPIDLVQSIGDVMPSDTQASYWVPDAPHLQIIKNWERLSLGVMPYFTGEEHITLFWRTSIADGNTLGKDSGERREEMSRSWYGGFLENDFITEQPFGLEHWIKPHPRTNNERALEFWALFSAVSEGMRMIVTTGGFIGLDPADVLEGDQIIFFAGLSVPILLRPASLEG